MISSGLWGASTAAEVSFEKLGRKKMMEQIKEVFTDQPGRPKPIVAPEPPVPAPVVKAPPPAPAPPTPAPPAATAPAPPIPAPPAAAAPVQAELVQAASGLLEAGLKFLESLAPPKETPAAAPSSMAPLKKAVSSLVRTDPETNRPVLAIPLPEGLTAERLADTIGGLLTKLAGASTHGAGA